MRCVLFSIPALLALTGAPVDAHDNLCRDGLFAQENQPLDLGIAGPGGAHVYYDRETCHLEGPRCRTAHVPPGGRMLLGRHRDGMICVYFPTGHDSITGWVKPDTVKTQPFDHNPPLRAWLGLWTMDTISKDDPYIRFRLRRGALMVKGESWTTGPENHIGGLDEEVRVTGYRAYDAECRTTFWLIGRFLAASDDDYSCFAPGADFEGVYVRRRH